MDDRSDQDTYADAATELLGKSELWKLVQDLRRREQQYRTLLLGLTEAIVLTETVLDGAGAVCDFRILRVNPAFERLLGSKEQDLLGKTLLEVLPEKQRPWVKLYRQVVASGKPARFEFFSGRLNRLFEVLAYRPDDHQVASVFTDITDRRSGDDARRRKEEQVQQIRARLQTLEQTADELVAPFRSIQVYAQGEILRLREQPQAGANTARLRALEQINYEAARAAGVVERLKAFVQTPLDSPRSLEKEAGNGIAHASSVQQATFAERLAELTPRERSVFDFLVIGRSLKEIAASLNITVQSVWRHRDGVLRKMGVANDVELARLATRCGYGNGQ